MAQPTRTAPVNDPETFTRQSAADAMDAMDDPELHGTDWGDLHFSY